MTKEEFWKSFDTLSLNDTTVAHKENNKTIEEISNDLKGITPDKLYRYRSFDPSDYNIQALERNEIWASSLSEMNDILEYEPYWNPDTVQEKIENSIEEIKKVDFNSLTEDYPGFKETFGSTMDLGLLKIPNVKEMVIAINMIISNESKAIINVAKEYPEIITDKLKETLKSTYVSCFTEDGCSNVMAGLYADGAEGFILEYNTKNLISPCIKKEYCDYSWACPTLHHSPVLIPVNYREERYDISEMLSGAFLQMGANNIQKKTNGGDTSYPSVSFHMDYLFPLKLAGRKDSSWKHEKEWRYVYSREGEEYADKRHIPLKEAIPSAIILCPNCSNENKEKVKSIANDHSIPIYQLVKDYRSKDYNAFKKELLC